MNVTLIMVAVVRFVPTPTGMWNVLVMKAMS